MADSSDKKRKRGHPPIYEDESETVVYATRLRRKDMVYLKSVSGQSASWLLREAFHALLETFEEVGGNHATN